MIAFSGCCWWGRGIIQTRGVCRYGKLNYYLGMRAAREGRKSLYPTIDFCEFPQGVCSSDETYGGELQWMVGLFEWVDRIQSYDRDGWNYLNELKAFADGGYTDFDFVDRVSSIINLGCHSPPCTGISPTAREAHNLRERNEVFQRFLNQLRVVYNFPAPPPPTPLPTPFPTEEPSIAVRIFVSPLISYDSNITPEILILLTFAFYRFQQQIHLLSHSCQQSRQQYPPHQRPWQAGLQRLCRLISLQQ